MATLRNMTTCSVSVQAKKRRPGRAYERSNATDTAAVPLAQQNAAAGPTENRWRLYAGRMPLIGLEPVADVLKGTPAAEVLQLHTYVLLEAPQVPGKSGVWCFDFLPLNPTSPATAIQLLTAGNAPGEVRVRKLASVQKVAANERVRLLGECTCPDVLVALQLYNRGYNKNLHLLLNNCTHYTNGLTQALLGGLGSSGQ